jgi:hypothetical protein
MKKLLLTILLALISTNAIAAWSLLELGQDEKGAFSVSFDKASIKQSGKNKKIWILYNYGEKPLDEIVGEKYLSVKTLYEVNCKEQKIREVNSIYYTAPLGSGLLFADRKYNLEFSDVSPSSIAEVITKQACKLN